MLRRVFIVTGVAIATGLVIGIGLFRSGASAENLTLEAASGASLASDPATLLVDIRRPEEWRETGVIEGALLVTYASPESFLAVIAPHLKEGQRLALICRSGNRTSRAARQIAKIVDFPVVDIQGGMIRVLREGYRPVRPSKEMGCQTC